LSRSWRRWWMTNATATSNAEPWAATCGAASGSALVVGLAFLLPHLHTELGMSLTQAGVLVAMPSVGMALALIAWGWLVDRTGEKLVLTSGSVLMAVGL